MSLPLEDCSLALFFTQETMVSEMKAAGKSYMVKSVTDGDLLYSVRAGIGPESTHVSAFCPGYYKGKAGLELCLESVAKEVLSFELGEVLNIPLTTSLSQGSFSLTKEGTFTVYKTVPVTTEGFDAWMKLLDDSQIEPEGCYAIRQCIARAIDCEEMQRLYFYSGMSKERQKIDVVPGMIIKIESQQYDSYTDWKSEPGMVKGAVSWYPPQFNSPAFGSSPYYSDNIVFLTGNRREDLDSAIDQMCAGTNKMCEKVVTATVNGRASVSLWHPVWVNGGQQIIPVGETLGQLCMEYMGAGALPPLTVKRWVVDRYLPVYGCSKDIVLRADRIDLEGR